MKIKKFFGNKYIFIAVVILFAIQIFTRFGYPDTKSGFGWDQIDNAWAAKNIIHDHKLPLVGMQAKGNTGFYIGPYYYYLITPFYLATNLDPIASIAIAGVTSLLMFFLVFFLIKDMINERVALIALFFEVFSVYIISLDRVQWPVNFIAPISLLVFYSLFKIANGKSKYILLLAAAFGFSLHIHFTSVFYIVLIGLVVPLFPRNKKTVRHLLYSLPILIFFLVPIVIATVGNAKAANYIGSTFLGIHLRRILQVAKDGFIEFEGITNLQFAKQIGFLLFPLYLLLLLWKKRTRKEVTLAYLSFVWIIIPWFAFGTYNGEITNYYFSITRPVVLLTLGYLIYRVINLKKIAGYSFVAIVTCWYMYVNLTQFFELRSVGLSHYKESVREKIKKGQVVQFSQGDPESYLYFIYKERYDRQKK